MESFGVHYARTLREWRIQFLKRWDKISRQGFDDAFKRKWEYYLAYCEAGFLERHVNVCQLILGRADETAYSYESAHREETLSPQLFRSLTAL
jgi:cyclopropane-fatty-acyl-phospholipid synthase